MAKRSGANTKPIPARDARKRAARADKSPPVASKGEPTKDPTVCDQCGAVFTRKTWRSDRKVGHAMLQKAAWGTCPACAQAEEQLAYGRILLSGASVVEQQEAILRRIKNVGQRAQHTQPERRIISVEFEGGEIEVLTSSQKLAHRIVHELKKTFGGRASYNWDSSDGTLFATWSKA